MDAQDPFVSAAAIRAESAWLRRLSVALVRRGDWEDDVQETWLAGLEHPPSESGARGGWLRVVLRNVTRKRLRSERRRQAREQQSQSAADADTPSSEELAVRLEAQRLVADLVRALAEPYRTTVLLCYYEGLTPADVGRRLGIPGATVRWRLGQAVQKLRAQIQAHYAPTGRSWQPLLAPLAPATDTAPWGLGKVFMSLNAGTKVALAGAAGLLLLTGGLILRGAPGGGPGPEGVLTGGDPERQSAEEGRPSRRGPAVARPRLLLPRFTRPSPSADAGADPVGAHARGTLPPVRMIAPDKEAIRMAVRDRLADLAQRVKTCMGRWATVDEKLKEGVLLTIQVDAMGLEEVWVEDRAEMPPGSLGCLSEAVYQTDWAGIMAAGSFKTQLKVRYARSDGGPPVEPAASDGPPVPKR